MSNVGACDRCMAALEPYLVELSSLYPGGAVVAYVDNNDKVIVQPHATMNRAQKMHSSLSEEEYDRSIFLELTSPRCCKEKIMDFT